MTRTPAQKQWKCGGAVFYLRLLFESGVTVIPYLTDRVNNTETTDKLLWDYAIHHLHLSRNVGKNGFVERADWLLFAIVTDQDVFFVDVRPHEDSEHLQWVRQDLLDIVHSNWPELTASRVLDGVTGETVTDIEKRELRRKNLNLNQYQGGMCISRVLKTTDRTPQHRIPPMGPNWVATDSAVYNMCISPWL